MSTGVDLDSMERMMGTTHPRIAPTTGTIERERERGKK